MDVGIGLVILGLVAMAAALRRAKTQSSAPPPRIEDPPPRIEDPRPVRSRKRRTRAKIVCALCDEMVDATTTIRTESGIVCKRCRPRAGAALDLHTHDVLPQTGSARVMCEKCEQLVDSRTTSTYEPYAIICPRCRDEVEAGPNRNAGFR